MPKKLPSFITVQPSQPATARTSLQAVRQARSFTYLHGNERTFQINVNSINQDVFHSKLYNNNALFFLLFLSFSPYQQLKRVFKHVLYLVESIIIIFDFEEINVLIEELFNLAGECKKRITHRFWERSHLSTDAQKQINTREGSSRLDEDVSISLYDLTRITL